MSDLYTAWMVVGGAAVLGVLIVWFRRLYAKEPDSEAQHDPPGCDTEWRLAGLAKAVRRRRLPPTLQERLERVADMVGGTVVLDRSSVVGHVLWYRGSRRFYYYETSMENGWWSFVAVRLHTARLPTFQVMHRKGSTPFPALSVAFDRPVGNERFDRRFEARLPTVDLRRLTHPLSETTAAQFVLLDRMLALPPFLSVESIRCRVALPGFLLQAPDPERAIEEACRLIECVLAQHFAEEAPAGDSAVDVMTVTVDEAATCRVCGEGIAAERVQCLRCGTPHHPECWEYTGGCSIFACQSKERR